MANQDAARGDTGTNTTMNAGRDHRSLIYVIAGSILALGLVLMAFYDRAGDSMPIAAAQKPVVTAQK
ncbi:hypothetical protein [Sphingomonas sp. OK281]|uniref:hypothetical protein n=1 Tax=Sphingomonas sp. OK281 TaxID=1881067 RepID=UPI0008EC9540|nr:hypothetical protein [Sphingomonas sp. OK281]SFN99117.1 hypothetical protein SAMN05428984_1471 [Sphingomonas sp. OK281]